MLVHMRNTSELEIFAKKLLRKFWYWYEKAKKISVLGQCSCHFGSFNVSWLEFYGVALKQLITGPFILGQYHKEILSHIIISVV